MTTSETNGVEKYLTSVNVFDEARGKRYEDIRREMIRLLQKERDRQKLSRYALAKRSKVSPAMLSLIERGLRNPTMETIQRIADGLKMNFHTLLQEAMRMLGAE